MFGLKIVEIEGTLYYGSKNILTGKDYGHLSERIGVIEAKLDLILEEMGKEFKPMQLGKYVPPKLINKR